MNKIKIQLIGTFYSCIAVELDAMEQTYFETIAKRMGVSLLEAIIDPYFYYLLRLEKYQSFEDLNGENYFGLNTNEFHQIELFVNGHKKQKFSYFDLNPENVLFPLYNINSFETPIFKNQLVIRTKEKGSINYTFQIQNSITIDEVITFNHLKIETYQLICGIQVEERKLAINRSDTVLIEQSVITF